MAAVWRPWVDRELPAASCDEDGGAACPYAAECHERFALAGVPAMLAPYRADDVDPDDVWATWDGCPRRYLYTYRIDQGAGSLAELARWALSRRVHRLRLTAGGSYILREYDRIRDHPRACAEREAVHRVREETGPGADGDGDGEEGGA